MEIAMIIVVVLTFAIIAVRFAMWFSWFRRELRYVNKEIDRTEGREQEHWKKRKKDLYRTMIPFARHK